MMQALQFRLRRMAFPSKLSRPWHLHDVGDVGDVGDTLPDTRVSAFIPGCLSTRHPGTTLPYLVTDHKRLFLWFESPCCSCVPPAALFTTVPCSDVSDDIAHAPVKKSLYSDSKAFKSRIALLFGLIMRIINAMSVPTDSKDRRRC